MPVNTPTDALFFAAGFGTRMAPLTNTRPKPLIEVDGKALIDHALDLGDSYGLTRRVVNIHYLGDMVIEALADRNVVFSDERDQLLDTGGGFRKAQTMMNGEAVFTMNTDAVWAGGNPFDALAAHWQPETTDAVLLLIPLESAIGYQGDGDFKLNSDQSLSRGAGYLYSGCQIVKRQTANLIEETVFSFNKIWDALPPERLKGVVFEGQWCDMGRPENIALAAAMLKEHSRVV